MMLDHLDIHFNKRAVLTLVAALGLWVSPIFADGIYRNGVGARSMSMGGADTAYASDPLGAMAVNPAGLGFLTLPELNLSLNGASAYGQFTKAGGQSEGPLSTSPGFFPDAAFAMRISDSPITVGLAFITDSAIGSDWSYVDPKSTGNISYGFQHDRSQILLFRSALGIGYAPTPKWSFGANVGLIYNRNNLESPYIFQNAPGLAGAKVLLDLNTAGYGYNAQVGALFRPTEDLQFGVSYKSPTTIYSKGEAVGDAGAQLSLSTYPFHYDAQVKNVLPQMVSVGTSWRFCEPLRLALQVDWINWAGAFNQLPVSLHNGSTTAPLTMVLPTAINDNVPLNWRDEFVYRAGLEYSATTNLVVRAGYCYGQSPVPDSTLTPMTAAIMEHTLTTGLGYHWSRYKVDFAYQWDIPVTRNIGTSSLQAGEYSNSAIQAGAHTFVLTTGVQF